VERQHGSSEEARTQIRREEERWQKEQGRSQRVGAQGRPDARAEQGGEVGGSEEAPVARFDQQETEKPATSPAFLSP
jgi:hypothetical protein